MCQKYFHDTNSLSLNVKINVRMFNKYQNLMETIDGANFCGYNPQKTVYLSWLFTSFIIALCFNIHSENHQPHCSLHWSKKHWLTVDHSNMYYVTEMGVYVDTRILPQLRRSGNHLFILGGKKLFIIIGNVKYILFIIIFLIIHCNISSFYSCGQQSTSVFLTSAMSNEVGDFLNVY
jgi:hypothetical protein